VNSAINAQVFALPTSIAVRKLPCCFPIAYEFLVLDQDFNQSELVFACGLEIAGLGFGIAGFGVDACAAADEADCASFCVSGLCQTPCVVVATTFVPDAEPLAKIFFELIALLLLTLVFTGAFFAGADSGFFSVNSNAGLGSVRSWGIILVGLRRVISAAGFTPAAAAARAAEAANAGCFGRPSMSGLTIT
jgi:hypothetical protein